MLFCHQIHYIFVINVLLSQKFVVPIYALCPPNFLCSKVDHRQFVRFLDVYMACPQLDYFKLRQVRYRWDQLLILTLWVYFLLFSVPLYSYFYIWNLTRLEMLGCLANLGTLARLAFPQSEGWAKGRATFTKFLWFSFISSQYHDMSYFSFDVDSCSLEI